jgi:hypothetical protein
MFAARLPPDRLPISKTHNPFKMPGLDMRSEAGRRFRDLAANVIAEHGSSLDPTKVRELAGLRLSVEIAQAALVNGDPKARNDLVRLSNLAKRAERELRENHAFTAAKAPATTLHERLAKRYAAEGGAS